MADGDDIQPAQVVSPMGGPDFAIPPWLAAAQQQQLGQLPPPGPQPSVIPGIAGLPPEVAAHLLGQPPPTALPPQKGPTGAAPKPGTESALGAAEREAAGGVSEEKAGLGEEREASAQRTLEESAKAEEAAKAVEQQNENLYGKVNPKTGQREGGLLAERQKQIDQYQAGLTQRNADVAKSVDAWSKYKVDPGRRWKNMGTGQKVMAGIGLMLSSIGMAYAGHPGENPAMKYLENAIQQDIAAQHDEMEKMGQVAGAKRSSLADYRQQTQDALAAQNLKVAEEYKRTADEIELAAAKHGSAIAKAQGAAYAAQLRQKAGALQEQAAQRTWDRDFKLSEQKQAMQIHRESLGVQYAGLKQQRDFHNDEVNERAAQLELANRKEEAAELRAAHAQLNDNGFMAPVGVNKATGSATWDFIKNEDGSFYQAPKETQKELRTKYEGTLNTIDALDSLRQLRHENGGDVNKWSADARAKAMEYERVLVGQHKASGINGFRGNVMEVMDKATTGGADPVGVLNSVMPLLDRARDNVQQDFDSALRAHNYTGKKLSWEDPLKQPAAPESSEKDIWRKIENTGAYQSESNIEGQKQALSALRKWAADIRSDDPKLRETASANLERASKEGGNKVIRDTAGTYLSRAMTGEWRAGDPDATVAESQQQGEAAAPTPPHSNFTLPTEPTLKKKK